jgi:hypothetical protein
MDQSLLALQSQVRDVTNDVCALLPRDRRLGGLLLEYMQIAGEIAGLEDGEPTAPAGRLASLKHRRAQVQDDVMTVIFLSKRAWVG